jgi:hypothetical protein
VAPRNRQHVFKRRLPWIGEPPLPKAQPNLLTPVQFLGAVPPHPGFVFTPLPPPAFTTFQILLRVPPNIHFYGRVIPHRGVQRIGRPPAPPPAAPAVLPLRAVLFARSPLPHRGLQQIGKLPRNPASISVRPQVAAFFARPVPPHRGVQFVGRLPRNPASISVKPLLAKLFSRPVWPHRGLVLITRTPKPAQLLNLRVPALAHFYGRVVPHRGLQLIGRLPRKPAVVSVKYLQPVVLAPRYFPRWKTFYRFGPPVGGVPPIPTRFGLGLVWREPFRGNLWTEPLRGNDWIEPFRGQVWSYDVQTLEFVLDLSLTPENRIFYFDFNAFPEIAAGDTLNLSATPSIVWFPAGLVTFTTLALNNTQVPIQITAVSGITTPFVFYTSCRTPTVSGKFLTRRGRFLVTGSGATG